MTAGSDPGKPVVAGGLARHIPVLARPALEFLGVREGGCYIDATFGAGGYTEQILDTQGTTVLALDRDPTAIALGAPLVQAAHGRLTLVEGRFSELDAIARAHGIGSADGVVLDVGVSSMQLDEPVRGFSFRHDGPLDMRMAAQGPSAADIVAAASERDLAAIIGVLGEERHARAVSRAIVASRREAPIETTGALAAIVARVVRHRPTDIHPATRTFQALRIFVNDELGELANALGAAERILAPGGRLVVVAFHSLEDRIVKTFLAERSRTAAPSRHQPLAEAPAPTFHLLTKRPVVADEAEIAANPRARSAKLRAAERSEAPARASAVSDLLSRLPALEDVLRGR